MMVNRYGCEECETRVDFITRDGPLYCECGEELEFVGKVGCVIGTGSDVRPDVREKIEEWREKGGTLILSDPDPVAERGRGMVECADELEEVLDDA